MFKLIQKMLLNELEHHVNTSDTEVTLETWNLFKLLRERAGHN